ncbi:hypothetical protein GQ600_8475 [Phytophthora cactorum]|nr:hypothetical protein GQ600_8475 [Phytophthora cactorum]
MKCLVQLQHFLAGSGALRAGRKVEGGVQSRTPPLLLHMCRARRLEARRLGPVAYERNSGNVVAEHSQPSRPPTQHRSKPMQFYREDYRSVLALLEEGTNRSDPYAVRRACAEFKRLVLHRNAVRHTMVEEGRLLPALVEIVTAHVQEEEGRWCQTAAAFYSVSSHTNVFVSRSVLTCLAAVNAPGPTELDIQSEITEAGALGLMVKGLEAHPQRGGCTSKSVPW